MLGITKIAGSKPASMTASALPLLSTVKQCCRRKHTSLGILGFALVLSAVEQVVEESNAMMKVFNAQSSERTDLTHNTECLLGQLQ